MALPEESPMPIHPFTVPEGENFRILSEFKVGNTYHQNMMHGSPPNPPAFRRNRTTRLSRQRSGAVRFKVLYPDLDVS